MCAPERGVVALPLDEPHNRRDRDGTAARGDPECLGEEDLSRPIHARDWVNGPICERSAVTARSARRAAGCSPRQAKRSRGNKSPHSRQSPRRGRQNDPIERWWILSLAVRRARPMGGRRDAPTSLRTWLQAAALRAHRLRVSTTALATQLHCVARNECSSTAHVVDPAVQLPNQRGRWGRA